VSGKIENLLKRASESNAADSSVTSSTRLYTTETEAESVFRQLIKKLYSIENWNVESEITSFSLFDADGTPQPQKTAAAGDYIKTTMPGSGKDDWIKIVEITESPDEIVLTVQPSRDPTDEGDETTVSHFFAADSTNNFCLQKKGAKITFYVIGLDEKSNIEDTGGIVETVRNFATANIGCYFGIQKTQWQTFCDNFIEKG
jgi:hypothetical protein